VPDPEANQTDDMYKSYGWSLLNLFDYTYMFHTGEFKLPLYQGQTLQDIDTRDINTLLPHEDGAFICIRIGLPHDEITTSQVYLPDRDTREYRIPSIHLVDFKPPTPDTPPEEIQAADGQP